jgi:hypothetical protein
MLCTLAAYKCSLYSTTHAEHLVIRRRQACPIFCVKADSYFVAHPDAEQKLGRRSLRAEYALSVMNWLITFHPERITCVRERIA